MKHTAIAFLNRFRDADALLAGDGLHLKTFAEAHGICTKSVYRLLATLRAMGYPTEERTPHFETTRHFYADGRRLFTTPPTLDSPPPVPPP